jgi:muramidase (phage lysozyme)
LDIRLIDDVSAPAKKVAEALRAAEAQAKALTAAAKDAGITDRLTQAMKRLGATAADIRTVGNAWQDYTRQAGLAANASEWTKIEARNVKNWENQNIAALRNVIRERKTYEDANKKAVEAAKRTPIFSGGALGAAAGGLVTYKAGQFAHEGLSKYQEYTDTNAIMRPVLDLTPAEQAMLKAQQTALGTSTRYSPTQIAEAQKLLGERGVSKDLIMPYVEQAVNYASAMNVALPDAVKTLEAYLFSTGKLKGVTDPDKARKIMQHATDYATHLSKISGLPDSEISAFFEYGGLAGSQAGLSDETVGGIAALMKRNQISGEKAGVAMRAIAAKMVSPTSKGLDALTAMGIDYNQFTKMAGGLSPENADLMMQRHFGKKLTESQLGALRDLMENPEIVTDREAFLTAAQPILEESFGKGKNGKINAKDAKDLAKVLGTLYNLSASGIDAEGLIKAIAQSGATLAQLNAFFGFQQGSRAGAALKNWDELQEKIKQLADTREGFAAGIAAERLNSFDGAVKNLEGSVETLQIRISSLFDSELKGFTHGLTEATNALIKMPDSVLRLTTEAVALVAIFGTLRTVGVGASLIGLTGLAAALGPVSTALTALAAAATVAYEAWNLINGGGEKAGKPVSHIFLGHENSIRYGHHVPTGPVINDNGVSGIPTEHTAVSKDLPAEARGLLDAVASGESGGDYKIRYGGGGFSDYSDHPGGGAAGRYQFLPSTWARMKREMGLKDFSPESQDKAAWRLAKEDYASRTGGRDLLADLKSGEFNPGALAPTWVSISDHGIGHWMSKRFHPNMDRALHPAAGADLKPVMTTEEINRHNDAVKAAGALGGTISPKVDTTGVDTFIERVKEAKRHLDDLHHHHGRALGHALRGALGPIQRGSFSTAGVTGLGD